MSRSVSDVTVCLREAMLGDEEDARSVSDVTVCLREAMLGDEEDAYVALGE